MAFQQEYIDRYKAQGFYKHVEWNRKRGILVKVYDRKHGDSHQAISFEIGTFDLDYDQRMEGHRQFFLPHKEAVEFMMNIGMTQNEIVQAYRLIQGMQVFFYHARMAA